MWSTCFNIDRLTKILKKMEVEEEDGTERGFNSIWCVEVIKTDPIGLLCLFSSFYVCRCKLLARFIKYMLSFLWDGFIASNLIKHSYIKLWVSDFMRTCCNSSLSECLSNPQLSCLISDIAVASAVWGYFFFLSDLSAPTRSAHFMPF